MKSAHNNGVAFDLPNHVHLELGRLEHALGGWADDRTRAIRKALRAALERNEIPVGEYQVRVAGEHPGSGANRRRYHIVQFVGGSAELGFHNRRYLYSRLVAREDWDWWMEVMGHDYDARYQNAAANLHSLSRRWYEARDQIESTLRRAGYSVANSTTSPLHEQVTVWSPTDGVGELGSQQYVVERSKALREYLLLHEAYSDGAAYMRLMFEYDESELERALDRARSAGVRPVYDPMTEGWNGGGRRWTGDPVRAIPGYYEKQWHFAKASAGRLHGRIFPPAIGKHEPVYDYRANQAMREYARQLFDDKRVHGRDVPTYDEWELGEKRVRWLVWNFIERQFKYDFLAGGIVDDLEEAVFQAETAAKEFKRGVRHPF